MDESILTPASFSIYFTEAYYSLYEKGLITPDQLERIIVLLDMMESLPPELFQERLMRIFPEIKNDLE